MASFTSFITKSLLTKIPPESLAEVLAPMKKQITEANLWANEKGRFKPTELAHFLHNNVSEQVANVLYAIHSIAKEEFSSDIDASLRSLGEEETLLTDIYIKATRLALRSLKVCNYIISKRFISERHSYTHYKPTVAKKLQPLTQTQIDDLKDKVLRPYFKDSNKGDYADIFDHTFDNYAFYCISHGSVMLRENSVEEELTVHTFRPELVDIVRLNLATGEISVFIQKTTAKRLKNYYVDEFRKIVAPNVNYVVNKKYLPNSIWKDSALNIGALVGQISNVAVVQFIVLDEGCQMSCTRDVSRKLRKFRESNAQFFSITFEFIFSANPKKKFNVRITDKGISDIPSGCNEALVERFFAQNGFTKKDISSDEFTLENGSSSAAA